MTINSQYCTWCSQTVNRI